MTEEARPTPEKFDEKITRIRVEIEYDLKQSRMAVRAKAPTVMIQATLIESLLKGFDGYKDTPFPEDKIVRVVCEYDMPTGQIAVYAQGPGTVVKGIIENTLGQIVRNQVVQFMQVQVAGLERRITTLEQHDVKAFEALTGVLNAVDALAAEVAKKQDKPMLVGADGKPVS